MMTSTTKRLALLFGLVQASCANPSTSATKLVPPNLSEYAHEAVDEVLPESIGVGGTSANRPHCFYLAESDDPLNATCSVDLKSCQIRRQRYRWTRFEAGAPVQEEMPCVPEPNPIYCLDATALKRKRAPGESPPLCQRTPGQCNDLVRRVLDHPKEYRLDHPCRPFPAEVAP